MADRQMLQDLYNAIFGGTPTTSRLDQAEEELADWGGDFNALANDWAAQDNSIHTRIQDQAGLLDADLTVPDGVSDDEFAEQLDEAVYYGQLVEHNYAELFGRVPNADILTAFDSDTAILELDPGDLTAAQDNYFDGGIDFPGFQYWVRELMDGAVGEGALSLAMIEGAKHFDSDDADLVALNGQGLSFFDVSEEREAVDLTMPPPPTHVIRDGGNDEPYLDFRNTDENAVVAVHESAGTDWWVVGGDDQTTAVTISDGNGLTGGAPLHPELLGVEQLYLRDLDVVNLEDAQDLGHVVFRDTATDMTALNVNPNTAIGIFDMGGDVTADFTHTAGVHDTAVQGFQGTLTLNGVSSSATGTRLAIDSQDGPGGENNFHVVADSANRLELFGDGDLTLTVDEDLALTRVHATDLDANLYVDVSDPGLAEAVTLFHAAVFGSMQDTYVEAGDTVWRDYPDEWSTFTFDGGGGHNTLATNANDLQDFNPGAAWDDEQLSDRFAVENLQILRVEGGVGGTRLGDRIENVVAEDDRLDDVADAVAGFAVLDTGLFGDALEEVIIDGAADMHVETRDTLTDITLDGTFGVDVASGSALESILVGGGAFDSTIFADGESMREVVVRDATNLVIHADGDSMETVSLREAQDVAVHVGGGALQEVSLTRNSDDVEVTGLDESHLIRFHGIVGSVQAVDLVAQDGVDTLDFHVSHGQGSADITPEGEDLDTLAITSTSSIFTGSLGNVSLGGMNDEVTVAFDGGGTQWIGVTAGEDTSHLTIQGTDEAYQELRLADGGLGGLVNGGGIEIGADAALLLDGDITDIGSLSITGQGVVTLADGPFNLFHITDFEGTFEVGRHGGSDVTLESINTDAAVGVVSSMNTVNIGYAQQYSGDAARVELDGSNGAIQIQDLNFTDGHARSIELDASGLGVPDEGDPTSAHYIAELNTEALGPDENAGNTEQVDLTGEDNLYLGLGVRDDDDGGTHDRLAGLADDGTITASGEGEFNAIVVNGLGEALYGAHELDLDQFADTPDSLGFNGGDDDAVTELSGWADAIRVYQDFQGEVVIEPAADDVVIDLVGYAAAGFAGTSKVTLADTADGTVTVQTPELVDAPQDLLTGNAITRLAELDMAGSDHLVVGVDRGGADWMSLRTVENLAANATIDLETGGYVDLGSYGDGIIQNADAAGDTTLTVNAALPEEDDDGIQQQHELGVVDMSAADNDVTATFNGASLIIDAIDASTAEGDVTVTMNGESTEMGDIDASAAEDEVAVTVAGAGTEVRDILAGTATVFNGDFDVEAVSVNTIDAATAETFNVTFGDAAEVVEIGAAEAESFDAVFGDDAEVGGIAAGSTTADPAEVNLAFGAGAQVGTIAAGGDESDVSVLFGDDADVSVIHAGGIDAEVTLGFGDGATVGTLNAAGAETVEASFGNDATVGTLNGANADEIYLDINGSGLRMDSLTHEGGGELLINSSGGGAGINVIEEVSDIAGGDVTISGDTAVQIGYANQVFDHISLTANAVVDLTELDANAQLGVSNWAGGANEILLYGTDVEDADRSFVLEASNDMVFDFTDMNAGQRVDIEFEAGGVGNIDEFLFDEVAFDLDEDSFLVNGVGIEDVDGGDWDDVFALAADNVSGNTMIHNAEGDFELELIGVSADQLTADQFDIV